MKTDRPDHSNPSATSNFPEEFNVHNILPEFKKEGNDWFAFFNPKVKRVLDVTLVHTLIHERCVCSFYLVSRWLKLFLLFPIVSCAASGSRRMGNIWQQAATVRHKYMTQRRVRKLGWVLPSWFCSHDIYVLLNLFSLHLTHFSVFEDDSAGNLYIRSVCFSPDGKYLITGADDKQIRVRLFFSSLNLSLSFGSGIESNCIMILNLIKTNPKLTMDN